MQLSQAWTEVLARQPSARDLEVAMGVWEHREHYRWRPFPERPVNFPAEIELLEIVDSLTRGETMDRTKMRLGSLFGSWRAMVRLIELQNSHHAAMLCAAYRVLDAIPDQPKADEVVSVLSDYAPNLDWGKAPADWYGLLDFAVRHLRNTSLMSRRLRAAGAQNA